MAKLLLIEDDPELTFTISLWLRRENYSVEAANTGPDGLERLLVCCYDVVILDLTLPGMNGIEVLRQFRAKGGITPVIILTGKCDVLDKEKGLDTGADDYLTKPFDMRELSARVRALLRRPRVENISNSIKIGNLELDLVGREIKKDGVRIYITPRDFALLEFLLRHPDQIFSAEMLLDRVWHADTEGTVDSVRSSFKRIRKSISYEDGSSIIETIPKVGYRLRSK